MIFFCLNNASYLWACFLKKIKEANTQAALKTKMKEGFIAAKIAPPKDAVNVANAAKD